MSKNNKKTIVLGGAQAMQTFRYEIAREIGLGSSVYEKAPKRWNGELISDAVSKRMIELADLQFKK
ncbi:hypothetical protein CIG75_12435 [Tumebacillus algifaecis]|uniref:Spore protein n=1 Tax=Tumebacillus algifaecis TaxID=1214604 RepID=A0A223D280_9BACL|nr:small, acid-soluble spore protein, alpha/beta type [Tumebacillus algifaecis]ASS75712.1 hypothetical protein CIG75_12435 [Tumebacillus algifaecis]